MTTLRKLIQGIDFNNKQLTTTPDWYDISQALNVDDLSYSDDIRLTAHFIKVHYCTDTYVGIKAYFLDGIFVAVSKQQSRKSKEHFFFVSNELAVTVREYLLSLILPKENDINVSILSFLDEEIHDSYKIEYNSQIMHKHALLDGKRVLLTKKNYDAEGIHSPNYFHTVEYKTEDGKISTIDCRKLTFSYNTLD